MKCLGDNQFRQLGIGGTTYSPVPRDMTGLSRGVVALAAGSWHTCAVNDIGGVKCWGRNIEGQLGGGSGGLHSRPVGVVGFISDDREGGRPPRGQSSELILTDQACGAGDENHAA